MYPITTYGILDMNVSVAVLLDVAAMEIEKWVLCQVNCSIHHGNESIERSWL